MTTGRDAGASWGRIVIGGLLVLGGVVWLADAAGYRVPWSVLLSLALILVGAALVVMARHGTHGGLVALGVVLTVVLAVCVSVQPAFDLAVTTGGVGERVEEPSSTAELEEGFQLGVGSLQVDLRGVDFPAGSTTVRVEVGMGQAEVVVPGDVDVDLRAEVGTGQIQAFGQERSGVAVTLTRSFPATGSSDATLVLIVRAGMGEVEVRR